MWKMFTYNHLYVYHSLNVHILKEQVIMFRHIFYVNGFPWEIQVGSEFHLAWHSECLIT